MARLVYLFELDSVRGSEQELQIGQDALFRETMINGNVVVLTFNQLTDSHAFLWAIRDEKSYSQIMKLFAAGRLRISLHGRNRTPSQFVQNSIEKCIHKTKEVQEKIEKGVSLTEAEKDACNSFIFSALPVRTTDLHTLELMLNVLRYADLGLMDREIENTPAANTERREDLVYIRSYLKMILSLNMLDIATNPRKTTAYKLFYVRMGEIKALLRSNEAEGLLPPRHREEILKYVPGALAILDRIDGEVVRESKPEDDVKQNRSNWVRKMKQDPATREALLAQLIIDLCYNFTNEGSITNISLAYDEKTPEDFHREFLLRLDGCWDHCKAGIHRRYWDEKARGAEVCPAPPLWEAAGRMLKDVPVDEQPGQKLTDDLKKADKWQWYWKLVRETLRKLTYALFYVVLFVMVEFMVGVVEGDMTVRELLAAILAPDRLAAMVGTTIFFGIVGSVISYFVGLPDILETTEDIVFDLLDPIFIWVSQKKRKK